MQRVDGKDFEELLEDSVRLHGHLCPGQVIGVRMSMLGLREAGIGDPRGSDRRDVIVFVEMDRCATDAVQSVTGCSLGKRTLRFVDYGKMAATFLNLKTGRAVRVAAREDSREKAAKLCPVPNDTSVTNTSVTDASVTDTSATDASVTDASAAGGGSVTDASATEASTARGGSVTDTSVAGGGSGAKRASQVEAYKVMTEDDLFDTMRVEVSLRPEDRPGRPLRRVTCEGCGERVQDGREVTEGGRVLCKPCAYGGYYSKTSYGEKAEAGRQGKMPSDCPARSGGRMSVRSKIWIEAVGGRDTGGSDVRDR